ncbi:MAG: 3'(2'),5'-bisphosphate nucleotidase CysQ [Parahaliea sp.]
MQYLEHYIEPLLRLCTRAGEAICFHYHAPGGIQVASKPDDSPLTQADLESHAILRDGLTALADNLPVLSEESSPDHKARRKSWSRYWLVDPLDGTKEFVAGTGEFTINIALIEAHRPVLGLLYLPLKKRAYIGIPDCLARRFDRDGNGWQARSISARSWAIGQPVAVLASKRHGGRKLTHCLDWLRSNLGPIERFNSGSALKFCDLAEGHGDIYPRFAPCSEWDVAAGQALLEAAGGAVLGTDGLALRYNLRDSLLSPHFLAIADSAQPAWRRYLETLN